MEDTLANRSQSLLTGFARVKSADSGLNFHVIYMLAYVFE